MAIILFVEKCLLIGCVAFVLFHLAFEDGLFISFFGKKGRGGKWVVSFPYKCIIFIISVGGYELLSWVSQIKCESSNDELAKVFAMFQATVLYTLAAVWAYYLVCVVIWCVLSTYCKAVLLFEKIRKAMIHMIISKGKKLEKKSKRRRL